MNRQVFVSESAEQDVESAADWWAENRSGEQAARWYLGVRRAIRSLASDADQGSDATEAARLKLPLKQRLFGLGRQPSHRIVFVVEDGVVTVLRVRHVAQRALTVTELS